MVLSSFTVVAVKLFIFAFFAVVTVKFFCCQIALFGNFSALKNRTKKVRLKYKLEEPTRFELVIRELQSHALPLG